MSDPNRSPRFFHSRGAAVAFFLIAAALLTVIVYASYGMLTRYNYGKMLPEDAQLRVTLIDEEAARATPAPTPTPTPDPGPAAVVMPTPNPGPSATPLPLSYFSQLDPKMLMPRDPSAPGEAVIRRIYVSEADRNRAICLEGWAYLRGLDAEKSEIYVVITSRSGSTGRRFYKAAVLPGASGVVHDASQGENLDRADFRAAFDVSNDYEEGPYRIGLLVINREGRKSTTSGYFDLDDACQFYVKSHAVTELTQPA